MNLQTYKRNAVIDLPWTKVDIGPAQAAFIFLGVSESWIVTKEGAVLRQTGLSRDQTSQKEHVRIFLQGLDDERIIDIKVSTIEIEMLLY